MPKRTARRARPPRLQPLEPEEALVVVCRGGECGNRSKHPGLDHAMQLQALRQGLQGAAASVAVSKCLDACEHSNVVVVVPGTAHREAGVSPLWLGEVLSQAATDDIVGWVRTGGPATGAPPLVDILSFAPTRLNRRELEEPENLSGHRV